MVCGDRVGWCGGDCGVGMVVVLATFLVSKGCDIWGMYLK